MKSASWFLKLVIWLVIIAVVLLAIFYFSFSQYRPWSKANNDWLEQDAQELTAANQNAVAQAEQSVIQPVRPAEQSDHLWGELSAPIQLIVYTDFDCPFCADFQQTLQQVKEKFGEQIVIVYRHYPLASHAQAKLTALAAECAGDKFLLMAEKLHELYRNNNNDLANILLAAEALNLDKEEFKKCLLDERYVAKIDQQKQEAETFGVIGTPTSFLNGMILTGAYQFTDFTDQTGQQYQGLQSLIEQELKKVR